MGRHPEKPRLVPIRIPIPLPFRPIEGFNQENAKKALNETGLLEGGRFGLAVVVAFGYRVNPQPEKKRQPLEAVVRWV